MIYDEVRKLIQQSSTDDTINIIDKAVEVLELYEADGYMLVYETGLGESLDRDANSVIDRIKEDTFEMIENLLQMQGIVINEDCLLSNVVELARATYESAFYEDKEDIKAIIAAYADDRECYCMITSKSGTLSFEQIDDMLISVTDNYKDNFLALLSSQEEITEENTAGLTEIVDQYIKARTVIGQENWCDQYVLSPSTIGLDVKFYIDQLKKTPSYLGQITKEIIEKMAQELYLIRVICNNKQDFMKAIADFFPNPIEQTGLIVAINKIKVE